MNNRILEIKKINKNFQHRNKLIQIFKNVNLNVKKGDLVALVGPSGSGKSTLLNMISLIDTPTSGQIIFNNRDVKNLKEEEKDNLRKKHISMIFQDNNLLADFTAIENVLLPLIIRGEKTKLSKKKAEKILISFNLKNRQNHYPDELSGGEQQRVAIARVLISETDLILADEPTGNLDTENSVMISDILFNYVKEEGSSLIMVTHDPKLANKAKRKIKIKDGKIK